MVSWLTFGSKNWPQTSQSPNRDPAIASSISFFCPSQKFIVPSANPAWRWNHTINLFMVWTLCLYGFSAGCGWLMALCYDDITPCPIGAKKVGLVGAIFTSSKHLLVPPWQKSIVRMHRLDLVSLGVWHRHHIGCCICSSGEDVSVMCQWCIVH